VQLRLFGQDIALSPAPPPRCGLYFVPEERLGRGAVPMDVAADNTLLTRRETRAGRLASTFGATRALRARLIERFNVKAGGPEAHGQVLSGGNLQKFIVGREILQAPRVLVCAQPTWGVDVGAAAFIRQRMLDLRDARLRGAGDQRGARRAVRDLRPHRGDRQGPPVAVRAARDATVEHIGVWMSGLWPAGGHRRRPFQGGPPCLRLEARAEPSRTCPGLAAARGGADAGGRGGVRAARQGPARWAFASSSSSRSRTYASPRCCSRPRR
jgi:hypothetical protein